MEKLKVLMCSEASFLSSGFSIYAKEILSRLHSTGKYDIAEFASYGSVNDPKDTQIKWKYYANAVSDKDPRHKEYTSRTDNQFGRWRFEKVLLDFKPDVVIDVRDYWMSAYQALSPLRKHFHWILMPTVDSEPQQESWLDTYLGADAIFTYSDWGAQVLKRQTSNKVNYIDTTAPGVDLERFKPLEQEYKSQIREIMGIDQNAIVIGSVMRNQKRKLIPDLFYSFRQLLDLCENQYPEIGKNLYFYLHTSYPDAGWDIPNLLKEHRISNRVLFTYFCKNCNNISSKRFCGAQSVCKKCGEKSCVFPSVVSGVSSEQLSYIYNCFDMYVQYAICEGAGMPQIEAAACGVPVFTVEYSAMMDVIDKLKATGIKVSQRFKELETKAIRVYPDNDHLVKELIKWINTSKDVQKKKKEETRTLTEKYYCWDNSAKKWEEYLDKLDSSGYRSDWSKPPTILQNIPEDISEQQINSQYFDLLMYVCNNNLQDHNMISSMLFLDALKDLDYGFTQSGTQISSYNLPDILNLIRTYINNQNNSEKARSDNLKFNDDFIQYAHMKGST
jgi:glycosyltransferase involved in cell wall biosynthesis